MTPLEYCQQKVASSHSSFTASFYVLPRPKREAMIVLYAFCREIDDAVDEPSDPGVAQAQLTWWREEVERIFLGSPTHPVGKALCKVCAEFALPQALFEEMIDGMEMDLTQHRYATFPQLQLYCYRVASVVGLLAAEIFGYRNRETLKYAHDLGIAFQLTNIIRDVGEDARRGRLYLPIEDLEHYKVTAQEIFRSEHTPRFVALMQAQANRAEQFYRQAMLHLPAEDQKSQRPGLMMAAIYRTLLDEIRRDDFLVLDRKTSLPPLRKLLLAAHAYFGKPTILTA